MLPKPKKWRKVLDTWERAVYRFEHPEGLWVEIRFDKKPIAVAESGMALGRWKPKSHGQPSVLCVMGGRRKIVRYNSSWRPSYEGSN
jgi:hypothetical protein